MSDVNIRQIIADSSFFSGLGDEAIEFLSRNARHRELAAGRVLFQQGDRPGISTS